MQFFSQIDHCNEFLMGHNKFQYFISKGGQNSEILHVWKTKKNQENKVSS
jgi:hypothetical protein